MTISNFLGRLSVASLLYVVGCGADATTPDAPLGDAGLHADANAHGDAVAPPVRDAGAPNDGSASHDDAIAPPPADGGISDGAVATDSGAPWPDLPPRTDGVWVRV